MIIPTVDEMDALFDSVNQSMGDEGVEAMRINARTMSDLLIKCPAAIQASHLTFLLAIADMNPTKLNGLIAIGFQLGYSYAEAKRLENLTK